MQLFVVVLDSRLDSSELSRACPVLSPGWGGERCQCSAFASFFFQAKDKEWWIKAFSQFCNKTANEEEEIVHKLLGDKFKVRAWWWLDVLTSWVCPFPACVYEPTFASHYCWDERHWKSQTERRDTNTLIEIWLT